MSKDKVRHLNVVKGPTADEVKKAECIAVLKLALSRAETGDVSECVMILKHPGEGDFTVTATPTENVTEWLGKLERIKFEMQIHGWKAEQE